MLEGKLIHVVDDDSEFLKGIARLLKAHGLEVRTFASAEEFQMDAEPAEADCLVLDIHLGGISGIELLCRLSSAGIRVPVVLVTADDSEPTRGAAAAAGCSAYLEKPVSGKLLMDAINGAVASAGIQPS
ncbi:response regulator [Pseudaminobacter arsenicus]|uniref:Response regulator n=1 Tax=Borborobacter arsenicus TaxID=1851146 RepID=A0A432V0Z3_9HYPH|nr:response regulator [Pseudaminobacter arsenicus]RUM95765.1 response regulator [Pseudaminobacter arsenicus]